MDCRCHECWGLAEYMMQLTGNDHGLPKAAGCKHQEPLSELRIVRTGQHPGDVIELPTTLSCDGSYTCHCLGCQDDRQSRVDRAARKAA